MLDSNGDINRKKLGELIFNDDSKRLALNSIIHPEIRIRIEQEIHLLKRTGNRIIVIDVPLLFETNYTSFVDKIITIFVEEDIQIERLKKRDQISTVEALARVNTQIPLSQKVKNSDAVIYNNAAIEETYQQLVHVLEKWGCIKT
ncbi:MAG: dephospho-CoA kinase [Bacillaceae bacterium]|nr:dephospho-CoA kinase [Bacillaceae bacterium]